MRNDLYPRFGRNLRKARLKAGLSQMQIAKSIRADKSYISNLEQGKKNPTLFTISKLAKGIGISISKLLQDI